MKKIFVSGMLFCASCLLFTGCITARIVDSTVENAKEAGRSVIEDVSTQDNAAGQIAGKLLAIDEAAQGLTPEEEYYIGRAVAGNVLASYRLYDKSSLTSYLNDICQVLVVNSGADELYNGYHVAVLDSDEVNAISTCGGHILVTRGLIECADSEDSLAAVIAHEVAHIQLKHASGAIKSDRIISAVSDIAQTSAGAVTDRISVSKKIADFGNSISDSVKNMVEKGYSQEQEFEADSRAVELMSNAGYKPSAMKNMLKSLSKNEKRGDSGFGKTHPSAKIRLEAVKGKVFSTKDKSSSSGFKKRNARFAKYKDLM